MIIIFESTFKIFLLTINNVFAIFHNVFETVIIDKFVRETWNMIWGEIRNILNSNQGVVAVVLFLLMVFGGLLKLFLKKHKKEKSPKIMTGNIDAGRDVIVAEKVVIDQSVIDPELQKTLSETRSELKRLSEKFKPFWEPYKSPTKVKSKDFEKVKTLITGEPTEDAKKKLRALFYSSSDNIARIQIALTLANWCKLPEDSIDNLITICDEGIRIASLLGARSEKAILLAYKGKLVSLKFVEEDEGSAFRIRASNLSGFPLITEKERLEQIDRLHKLDKLTTECFVQAENFAIESRNLKAIALVRSLIGQAAGERCIHFTYFGLKRAEEEKNLCKRALLSAKEIYARIGDELGTAYALHNLANQLRFFGEKQEAKHLTEEVIKIATKHNEQRLAEKARKLQERLTSGRIPRYTRDQEQQQ